MTILSWTDMTIKVLALSGDTAVIFNFMVSITSILGSWIINEFENLDILGTALGKQNLRITGPKGKLEFKYFSNPDVQYIILATNCKWIWCSHVVDNN